MGVIISLLPNFTDIFHYAFLFLFKYYGWVLFVWALLDMMWFEYLEEIQGHFVRQTDWVFLKILVPKENTVSTLAVEGIFTQMHALHASVTWEEAYMRGKFQLWYSLEIVSLGGIVSFIIRCPKKTQHLVESAFYSQYPSAEIHEVSDYMENFKIDPFKDDNEYDFFGTEWKMVQDSVIPMKTYKDFEHPSAEEKIIDPLTNVIETLERIGPHELLAMQLLIQPIQNDEWAHKAERKIKELTGEEMPHHTSFWGILMIPFEWFAKFSYKETLLGGGHGHHDENQNKPKNNWMSMTEAEKLRVSLIENKVNKACYNAKIRFMYIAPKEGFKTSRNSELIGALRQFSPGGGAGTHNTLKIDRHVWTKEEHLFSKTLEAPMVESAVKKKKYWFMRGFKNRSMYVGSPKFLLGVEEIATLYHFPITSEGKITPAQVQTVASKTSRPPKDLPIGEME